MNKQILGIPFLDTDVATLVEKSLDQGGLVVVPSGPGLSSDLMMNDCYRTAVTNADIAITDSGAMVLFWKLFHGHTIGRVSGLRFLKELLKTDALKPAGQLFWVHPTTDQRDANEVWLKTQGFELDESDSYIAPLYPKTKLSDAKLFGQLEKRHPKAIILCIGGGVQERLGYWLKEQYQKAGLRCPAIICTGAAIGFLSGHQANIPSWADRLYLGWALRCFHDPKSFMPRYWRALPLAYLIARHGKKLPPKNDRTTK
jgi:UDP-N-acetyl-D-mannosaminuronic acid transferase (WecB/TagA/CpsF family)